MTGGYILIGYGASINGNGGYDAYLIKTDPDGNKEWIKTFGGADDDRTLTGQQTSDGGYILTGYTKSFGAGEWDVYLVRADSAGDTLWTRTFGGKYPDTGYTVSQCSDGGFIITGETWSFGAGKSDLILIKTDKYGKIEGK